MKRKLSLSSIKHIDDDGVIHVDKKIETLDDLINLSNMYIPGYLYNIDLYRLQRIREPLVKLNKTIGLEKIKKDIIKHILFFYKIFKVPTMTCYILSFKVLQVLVKLWLHK